MRITIIGGGPGGLYAAALLKRDDPSRTVELYERNPADQTFGFGVVFSDATLDVIAEADPATYSAITADFAHWDDIEIHAHGRVIRSTGHGFSGLSRQRLLAILQTRCRSLGVILRHSTEADFHTLRERSDLVIAADGVNSAARLALSEHLQPRVELGRTRFCWLGTTRRFPAFTFYFRRNEHGLFRVHAYDFEQGRSTFIVEATEATWRAAGLDATTEAETAAYCEALFSDELDGARLLCNRSIWRQFPTISCARWSHDNFALLGDAVHTAHFSVGSGTKLAMEDAIALAAALRATPGDLPTALAEYQTARTPAVESLQRAAAVSMAWFEDTERLFDRLPPEQFAYSLLTRSLRINHDNLAKRDPALVADTERWFAAVAAAQSGLPPPDPQPGQTTPPLLTPFRLRDLVLPNRVVVSPMCQYSAQDGTPDDWHLVHLASRALGGAGLVIAEMTDVSADARISPGCTGLYLDAHVSAWRRITDFIHAHTPSAVGIQIGHAGRKGATRVLWEGPNQPLEEGGWPLVAPSALPFLPHSPIPKEMDRADMDAVREDFVRAAERAEAAGFDLLEIHLAHGYLLASFLSPITNRREDAYGGALEARLRYPLEIVTAVRAVWPRHKPLSARISATDWMPGGLDADDAVAVARALKAAGVDLIDVSTGQTDPGSRPQYGRLYQTPFSERVRLEADIATITVGGISSHGDVNAILAAGRADLCAIARAHLFDPYWTRHAAHELGHAIPWPPQYSSIDRYLPRMEWSPRGQQDGGDRS